MKIQIFGDSWKILVQDAKKFDKDTEAETRIDTRIIKFKANCSRETIRHEVSHVIYSYMVTLNLRLNINQQEEFLCEFIEKYGPYIERITTAIYNKL